MTTERTPAEPYEFEPNLLKDIRASVEYCAGRAPFGSSELADNWRTSEMLLDKLDALAAQLCEARGVIDECHRLSNPGVESDAPTDGRGQRLDRIYRITTKATPATVEHIDGLGCWCRPYRDGIEPNLIVHRKAEEA